MVTKEILKLKSKATQESLKLESKTIVGTYVAVIENSDDDFWWSRCSQMNSSSLYDNYSVLEDEVIIGLCTKAIDAVEKNKGNLGAYIEELEAKVNEGIPLEHEYNEIAYGGPMTDELGKSLEAWSKEHDGFSVKQLHEDEFILAYCKGKIKQGLGYIPMPMHIKKAFEMYPNDILFGIVDGKEVAFPISELPDSGLKKNNILNEKVLGEYLYNPHTNKPYSRQALKALETIT